MLVIGDVCGKGSRAAGVTALARHTLRAASMSGQSATEMLETLHRALRRQSPGADLCTACLVTVAPASGHMPVDRRPSPGTPRRCWSMRAETRARSASSGTLLGVLDPIDVAEYEDELRAGETLLLYTDGIPEAGRGGEVLGERGLLDLCRKAPRLTLAQLLEHIEQTALERAEDSLRDDLALLGMRMRPSPAAVA